jgi:S-formylglutathione hydrolase FrmB
MRGHAQAIFTLILVLLVVLCAATGATAASLRTDRDLDEGITSIALNGRVHARVVLPAGYADSGKRYPVVYFLHGLPAGSKAYDGNDWLIDAIARAGPAILVVPQGARDSDTDPEYLNWGAGRNWETYVSEEVPRYIDKHFRTIHSRSGRAILGVSAGGYGATILGLHHLGAFSVIESWSGYFHPTDPTGTEPLARGPAANAHTLIGALRSSQQRQPTFFAFYVGRGDKRFRAENVQFDQELTAAHVRHVFELYKGAHQTSLWTSKARSWLGLALAHLAKPTTA